MTAIDLATDVHCPCGGLHFADAAFSAACVGCRLGISRGPSTAPPLEPVTVDVIALPVPETRRGVLERGI